jgi:hypothetical protein
LDNLTEYINSTIKTYILRRQNIFSILKKNEKDRDTVEKFNAQYFNDSPLLVLDSPLLAKRKDSESRKEGFVNISMKDVNHIEEDIIIEEVDPSSNEQENPFTPYNKNLAVGRHISFGEAADSDNSKLSGFISEATKVSHNGFNIQENKNVYPFNKFQSSTVE